MAVPLDSTKEHSDFFLTHLQSTESPQGLELFWEEEKDTLSEHVVYLNSDRRKTQIFRTYLNLFTNYCFFLPTFPLLSRCQWPRVLKDCHNNHINNQSCYLINQVKEHLQPLECLFTVMSYLLPHRTTYGWLPHTAPPITFQLFLPAAGQTVRALTMQGGRSSTDAVA